MLALRFGALAAVTGLVGVVVAACTFKASDGKQTPDAPPSDLPPVIQFQFKQTSTDEADGGVKVKLVMSRVATIPASVTYSVVGGSATPDGMTPDYAIATGQTGTIEFAPGETMKELDISIARDIGDDEPDETIELVLQAKDNATIGENSTNRVTIAANFLPRVQFEVGTSNAVEETPQTFRISMNTTSPQDVVVEYAVVGTAAAADTTENPRDHMLGTSGSVMIPAGMLSVDLDPQIVNDLFDENDETIDITINPVAFAKAGQIANRVHTITNADAPPTVQFGAASSTTPETGMAIIPVTITPQSGKTVTVDYAAIAGGSAAAGDFTVVGTTLTFTPGVTTQNVVVNISVDDTDEDDENASIGLASPSNATIGATPGHDLTILDDDSPPSVSFQQITNSVDEDVGTVAAVVELSEVSGRPVTVTFTLGGTAQATGNPGDDYSVASTSLVIPAGMPSGSIVVTVIDDAVDEDPETAVLTLTDATNASLGANTLHTITLNDDDDPPEVRWSILQTDRTAAEGAQGTTATFDYNVTLSAASSKTVTVGVGFTGTANGADFTATGVPVVFTPGLTTKAVRIVVNGDNATEGNNTIIMTLQTPTNATNAADNQVRTHTILNDD